MKFVFLLGRRMIVLIVLVLLGLEGIFYVYYTPSAKPLFIDSAGPTRDTLVLIWDCPFGHRIWRQSCRKQFDISGCRLTNNHSDYENADGVMFHHRDIQQNVSKLWNMSRPPWQKWVWMNMESPENSHRAPGLDELFNLTATYRRDSDVWVPYGRIVQASDQHQAFKIPEKDKLVCWVVKNWNQRLKRVEYFKKLRKHINIDTYGGYFNKVLNLTEYFQTISSCKFYLAFENSIHRDYFTEKLFNPMSVGTVPVVLGPPRENYEEFLPAHSFIHVDDFESPRELAKYLTFLDQNPDFYERYFTWRKHFAVTRSSFALEHACRICDYLRRQKGYRVVKNLSTWYWS
ncbi:4-galactosyl-N-acetylglucosaminide 3-alpha-L-fucosyltransferase 9-like [Trichomycterus rosablanca]|uniref:4-galactosyl-N-acetylglucosaminide 3-alpha-L-fucosyltransferase 9-like n=1 Tax=Trichomycterus rosablanca TaxID=2290929 RepID=UPI002F35DBE7